MSVPIRSTAFLFALFAPAMALGAPFDPIELSDPELAQLRGRYVLPEHVVHFGVTLTSSWEQSGQQLGASVSLQLQQGIQPVLTVSPLSSGSGDSPAQGSGIVIGGQGLSQVDGISQSVRTAGDLNTARNDVQINIERNGQAPTLDGSGTPLNGAFVHGNALATPPSAPPTASCVSASPPTGRVLPCNNWEAACSRTPASSAIRTESSTVPGWTWSCSRATEPWTPSTATWISCVP